MNLAKLYGYYNCGLQIAHRIGARNIIFFGLLGTAAAVDFWMTYDQQRYYGFHIFKRVKPTQTIYEHPY